MKEISNIISIIEKIPNNQRYFLPNIVEKFYDCQISQFSKSAKIIELHLNIMKSLSLLRNP